MRTSSRIVPKNLFLSAQRGLSEEAVRAGAVTHSNIRDLCTLITLSMLYDEIETLGNKAELEEDCKPYIAAEYQSICDLTGLKINVGPAQHELNEVLKESVSFAVRPFVKAARKIELDALEDKLSKSLRDETSDQPDYWEDFAEGRRLLLAKALDEQSTESENFLLRSFLYAGLASNRQRPFVPDAIRSWGMHQITVPSSDYGEDLERIIEAKYPPGRMWELIAGSPFPIPPFAATVFLRADSKRQNLPKAIKSLRDDLTPVRDALAHFQREKDTADYRGLITIFGKVHTR